MKDLHLQKPTGMRSLSVKLALLVFICTLGAGIAVLSGVLFLQRVVVLEQEQASLAQMAQHTAKQVEQLITQKEKKALAANQLFTRALSVDGGSPGMAMQPQADGAVRIRDSVSGAFLPAAQVGTSAERWFSASKGSWPELAAMMRQDFFNFYFISHDHFIRISPADWALEVDAEHNFDQDVFFRLATPEQNPARVPRWTPVYFDDIWQHWMTSLIVPVYLDDRFVGVTGADYILDDLFADLASQALLSRQYQLMVFERSGNLLLAPGHQPQRDARMNTLLQGMEISDPELKAFKQQLLTEPERNQFLSASSEQYLLQAAPIERLGWFLTVYRPKADTFKTLQSIQSKVFVLFVLIALIVAVLLQFFIYRLVLKRLNRVSDAIVRLGRGGYHTLKLDQSSDEIGVLNRAVEGMSGEIAELLEGLNTRIAEKEQAERSTKKLTKAVAFSSSGIVLTDAQLGIEYLNPFLVDLLLLPAEEAAGKSITDLIATEMAFVREEMLQTILSRHHWRGDILLAHQAQQCWMSMAIAPIRDEKGTVTNYVCALQDISFIKESQQKMEQLAYFDVLTGLANRGYFREQLRKALAMSQRGHYAFALLYFDLDEFKLINDTLGHDAGDELLKEVAKRLISRLREEDTIARLGGDEFAVILSGIESRQQAALIAENLQHSFAMPVKLGSQEVAISASIGITMAPEDAGDEELLLKHADLAMYEAKARGKNTFHFFSQDLNEAAKERLELESQLREAIREHQFMLYYQPKIDLNTNHIVGYEALIRWLRPDNKLVPPARFIPVAESTGLIVQIGEWVLWEGCRFLARQCSRGLNVDLSINLSARQFRDNSLAETVERILKRTGVEPKRIIFEITESMLMGDTDAAIHQLNQLKSLGVSLSIDDFGTGYSSLSYLKRFPVDELKIDRSFVQDIPEDTNDMDIVSAIIAMAQQMNLRVVAEGVETVEQVAFLKQHDCTLVQGYYFSMPLAEQELNQLEFTIN
ncbi:bifunctional diguanylate cyclase/phosphodiesterase [Alkalimonas amylolytica]|uniref:cyclic-guanylate-specific phosphodiesterase n=1 Tax=Alkalimonas amylolytica TaxID=152573 RepID=A0A1H3X3K2_ALKAM|nr:EAL domain-containing protein [Alkalimonas amylolytica]SDZ93098.1 PAS domain S-box-containing protein/diguanylate cyclase (GGDEF) domain-containing protein [Alkalimonas amylolytica]